MEKGNAFYDYDTRGLDLSNLSDDEMLEVYGFAKRLLEMQKIKCNIQNEIIFTYARLNDENKRQLRRYLCENKIAKHRNFRLVPSPE